jgi:hypothetical protein
MNKQNEKYKTMLRRKNKEKKIYKDKNASLQLEKQKLYRALLNREQKIERLNNIIKEALILTENTRFEEQYAFDEILLPILNKLRESGIRNYIKVEGSDKEWK